MTTALISLLLLGQATDPVDEAFEKFVAAYRSPSPEVRAQAVKELARTQHPRVLARFVPVLEAEDATVRVAAAQGLGGWTEHKPKAAAVLLNALGPNARVDDARVAIFAALGALRERSALPALHKAFMDPAAKIVRAALEAAAAVGSRDSIDPILDLMRQCQDRINSVESQRDLPGSSRARTSPEYLRTLELHPATIKAMQSLTKERFNTTRDWLDWWKRNRATFREPGR